MKHEIKLNYLYRTLKIKYNMLHKENKFIITKKFYKELTKKLLNVSSRSDTENIYIWELHAKLMSNVINVVIYNIENLI